MADISSLGTLNSTTALDLDTYKPAAAGFQLPRAGRYTARAPESFSDADFSKTKKDFLLATVNPTIVGPTNEGFQIRYCRISAKTYDRKGETVSQLGDYLKACGMTGEVPSMPQAQADAVERTAGATYEVDIDWEARHWQSGFEVKGMSNFPSDGNGGKQQWVTHPTEKDAEGNPLRLRANLVVKRFIPLTN